ncbi:hypothetical protein NM208_g14983 [Fusarium decemcellulare]|uniref:Uncharacterized protein n=1 Tax=Fusarium decemcellulare TaxID=57161 RepID=A0ACC1RFS4_9HYPO|nr:hypothetical protein NM208_g14983 [Fusarium decemcellulare]
MLSAKLGIDAPDFSDEKAVWAHSFEMKDASNDIWHVQLPRVYIDNKYDAKKSEELFLERFSADKEEWKHNALSSSKLERRAAAWLKLQYCTRDKKHCTGFDLQYDSNGCQDAPKTGYIEVFYSKNAAFVSYNKANCQGHMTLWSKGCDKGPEDILNSTPSTRSFQYIVGCNW